MVRMIGNQSPISTVSILAHDDDAETPHSTQGGDVTDVEGGEGSPTDELLTSHSIIAALRDLVDAMKAESAEAAAQKAQKQAERANEAAKKAAAKLEERWKRLESKGIYCYCKKKKDAAGSDALIQCEGEAGGCDSWVHFGCESVSLVVGEPSAPPYICQTCVVKRLKESVDSVQANPVSPQVVDEANANPQVVDPGQVLSLSAEIAQIEAAAVAEALSGETPVSLVTVISEEDNVTLPTKEELLALRVADLRGILRRIRGASTSGPKAELVNRIVLFANAPDTCDLPGLIIPDYWRFAVHSPIRATIRKELWRMATEGDMGDKCSL